MQRAGRAARGKGRTGLAVLLVEKSAYEIDLNAIQGTSTQSQQQKAGPNVKQTKKRSRGRAGAAKPKREKGTGGKMHCVAHGSKRGSRSGEHDVVFVNEQPKIDNTALDEGLYVLVQTGVCRRKVLTEIYGNKQPCE